MTRDRVRDVLALVVCLIVGAGGAYVVGDALRPDGPAALVDRAAYSAGWAYAVDYQTGPAPRPPRDDLTRAACRWRIDGGVNPPAPRLDRTGFLQGCDDAVTATDLERPQR